MKCRHCKNEMEHIFLDLGFAPPSNAYLKKDDLKKPEMYFPLKLYVCDRCWLVQTEDYAEADQLFDSEYAYFSSVSVSWLEHAKKYCNMITQRLSLGEKSFVVEIASNDGYLLKNFVENNIPCLGIEPTDSTADAAEKIGVPVLRKFFGEELGKDLASKGKKADLILGNNVFAHVPDINDFTKGMKQLLKQEGTITLEFPHLLQLLKYNQFDTVYHEHYSYLSLFAVQKIFSAAGLRIYDVEELPTHGGSLRIFGCHEDSEITTSGNVKRFLDEEKSYGMQELKIYKDFQVKAEKVKNDIIKFLIEQKEAGNSVAAYGAAAKGNTLLNYAGVKPDLLPVVFDAAPSKQEKYLPGSHIPIKNPEELKNLKPDYIVILPWNIKDEVVKQLDDLRKAGTKFAVAVPGIKIL